MDELGMKEGFDVGLELSGHGPAFRQMLEVMNHGGPPRRVGCHAGVDGERARAR
jgi:threonine 3-dehydrogenase